MSLLTIVLFIMLKLKDEPGKHYRQRTPGSSLASVGALPRELKAMDYPGSRLMFNGYANFLCTVVLHGSRCLL